MSHQNGFLVLLLPFCHLPIKKKLSTNNLIQNIMIKMLSKKHSINIGRDDIIFSPSGCDLSLMSSLFAMLSGHDEWHVTNLMLVETERGKVSVGVREETIPPWCTGVSPLVAPILLIEMIYLLLYTLTGERASTTGS